jgi:hypothetical protein
MSKMLTASALEAAERFTWLNARLIDRLRFAHLFRGGAATPVVAALRPYQNDDGGFGNALEPDFRGPVSQPATGDQALRVLAEVDAFDDPMVGQVCDYFAGIAAPDGGLPFVLPSVRAYPRAPWWQSEDDQPPGNLLPTASIVGLLLARGVQHPWLEPATEFCWRQIDRLDRSHPYQMRSVIAFLDRIPDRQRAEQVFAKVGPKVLEQGLVELDPAAAGEVEIHTPLDFAPEPSSLARGLFADDVIEAHLDALVAAQQDDGGWTFNWPVWTPAVEPEWRGFITIEMLLRLRAYGRLAG